MKALRPLHPGDLNEFVAGPVWSVVHLDNCSALPGADADHLSLPCCLSRSRVNANKSRFIFLNHHFYHVASCLNPCNDPLPHYLQGKGQTPHLEWPRCPPQSALGLPFQPDPPSPPIYSLSVFVHSFNIYGVPPVCWVLKGYDDQDVSCATV